MRDRGGEKVGWIGGWLGGFIWVLILSVVFLVQGKLGYAAIGLLLAGAAVAAVLAGAPWRHPETPYWKLMLPVYVAFFASLVWLLWSYGGTEGSGLDWWHLVFTPLLLSPFWTIGRRRWSDAPPGSNAGGQVSE